MLRVRQIIVAIAIFIIASILKAQGPELVDIRLTQPPPNQLRIADLWKVELNNRSGRPVRVYLHGTAEETSIPDGIIADARTKIITVPPGRSVVTGNDVQPITVDQSNNKYRDALLRTGSVPSGAYTICCEVISEETDQVIGRDCKFVTVERMTIPILIAPPDESVVMDKFPTFSWLSGSPPASGFRPTYRLKIVEVFNSQSPYSAMAANPAWFIRENIPNNVFLYPVSSRSFEVKRKYAWMITAFNATDGRVPMGESEIWWFTYNPETDSQDDTTDTTDGDQADKRGTGDTTAGGGVKTSKSSLTADMPCGGENWDFELGTLGCWTVDGEAFVDDPVLDDHPVLGQLGHHAKYWVTSLGPTNGDGAVGAMLSEEFQIKTSTIGFLCGGMLSGDAGVELLVEKLAKDTFKLPSRRIALSTKEFYVAHTTNADLGAASKAKSGGTSDRLDPVEWDVTKFLNRVAFIIVRDSTKVGHVNVDYFRFYDREKDDSVKLPVLVMSAGENHSLAATPQEKPKKNIRDMLSSDVGIYRGGGAQFTDLNVVNDVSTNTKRFTSAVVDENLKLNPSFKASINAEDFPKFTEANIQSNKKDGPELYEMNASEAAKYSKAGLGLSALNPKNIVWGWGDNLRRAVGKDYGGVVPEPMKLEKVKEVKALAAGMDHSFAVTKAGAILGWGFNDYWQLGTDDRVQKNDPVDLKVANIIQVATGSRHALALNDKGQVYVWGYNRTWECGTWLNVIFDNTTGQITANLPMTKPTLHYALNGIAAVAAGHSHSVALSFTGAVFCWGANNYGQCGVDPDDLFAIGWPTPVVVPGAVEANLSFLKRQGFTSVSAGDYHTMALDIDGRVWAWGGNASGQLGDGTNKDRPAPGLVKGLPRVKAIAAGSTFSLALDSAGNLWAWGNNALGQLGDGTRVGRIEPVKVSRLDAVAGVVAGGAHGMAVRADGGLWTWGTNEYGQLGEGPITNLTPVPLDPPLGPFRVEKLASP
ncbi:MAG: hypothetical protein SGJ05_01550 [bacterium]|nr:hypothetical protein [bacterium]